jgi:hypothetical protein
MIHRGIATFTLDEGRCPKWLFERMVKLGKRVVEEIVAEIGPDEFIKRIGDPVWFQSLGTTLAFDWNASGLTTILTAVLKEVVREREGELGIFICGGKGKTSRKTPQEIEKWGNYLSLPENNVNNLIYNSRMAAKVDSSLVQDGYQIYHHAFFFTKSGAWTVVQQGMNNTDATARRYHWHSQNIKDLILEPHSGIIAEKTQKRVLNLTARQSQETREISTQLLSQSFNSLMKDIILLQKYVNSLSKVIRFKTEHSKLTLLKLENKEFVYHPVLEEDFINSKYLKKILEKLCWEKPENYEALLASEGVGPKTIRALALVSEIIYGAKPSYEDPARYSFAHGGKDATPYPVDCKTYDKTIEIMNKIKKNNQRP